MTPDPRDNLDAWRMDYSGPGPSRREVVRLAAAATAAWTCGSPLVAADDKPRKTHFVTLSFDDEFGDKLRSFDPRKAVFNFPYNRSTPAVEEWLAGEVMAFRTSGPGVNRLPDRRRQKLTCTGHGPDAIDEHLTAEIDALLAQPSGWLIYNTHGLDGEGWGPLSSEALERLLERLVAIPTVAVVPAARALLEA